MRCYGLGTEARDFGTRLQAKLDALLTTAFIQNDSGVRPDQGSSVLHVPEWNINRGENEDDILLALTDVERYVARVRGNPKFDGKKLNELSDQLQELQTADVVVLDEVITA